MLSATRTLTLLCLWFTLLPTTFSAPAVARAECPNLTIRREWRKLSIQQRTNYHNAVKCVGAKPSVLNTGGDSQNILEDLTWVHYQLRETIHHVASFLPWHRWFMVKHEEELRKCNYTGPVPYWDWTLDSGTPENYLASDVFDPVRGFGSVSATEACVRDGPYSGLIVNIPERHCLRKGYDPTTIDPASWTRPVIDRIMQNTDFRHFWNQTERIPHDRVHDSMSGDFLHHYSPGDPLFYLHHAQLDRMWALWQGRNATRLADYGGNRVQNTTNNNARSSDVMTMLGFADNRTVASIMDTQSTGLCYMYEPFE